MGISGLLPLLKSIHKFTHIKAFAGQTVAIDAYGWLHKGTIACAVELALGKPTRKYIDYVLERIRMLQHHGVTPYMVFDGDYLPNKAGTEADRARKRDLAKQNAIQLQKAGRHTQAHLEFQKAIDVTPTMASLLIEDLKKLEVQYLVAPYEADAQMAYLELQGFVTAIISEDSDLLVFGVQRLITKLDQFGNCIEIDRNQFNAVTEVNIAGWTDEEFRRMCILSGCDYLPNIPRMGLKTAHRLVRRHKNIEKIIRVLQYDATFVVPSDYLEKFQKADMTFLHQIVFCPMKRRLTYCRKITGGNISAEQCLNYLGTFFPDHIAVGVAEGVLDPMSKKPIVFRKHTSQMQVTKFFKATDNALQIISNNRRLPIALSTGKSAKIRSDTEKLKENVAPLAASAKRSFSLMSREATSNERIVRGRLCDEIADNSVVQLSPFFSVKKQEPLTGSLQYLGKPTKTNPGASNPMITSITHTTSHKPLIKDFRTIGHRPLGLVQSDAFFNGNVVNQASKHKKIAIHENRKFAKVREGKTSLTAAIIEMQKQKGDEEDMQKESFATDIRHLAFSE